MLEPVLDDPLIEQIKIIQEGKGDDFWSFRNASKRSGAHSLIHYPAMMVPNLQGKLLDAIMLASPEITDVLDPFVGSGTVLVESMSRGLNFTGIDINPLAALACLAKSGPYYIVAFNEKTIELQARIACDPRKAYFVSFEGHDKWFESEVSYGISRIARNIEKEPSLWARRLFWLALAKVIRASSNSRMSTYKLHIQKLAVDRKTPNPLKLFEAAINKFSTHLLEQHTTWVEQGLMLKGRYVNAVDVNLGDSRQILDNKKLANKFDVVMTSPPYGDNVTTIPYGQYAYLPMKWIECSDVCGEFDRRLTDNTHATDTASLGGSRVGAIEKGRLLAMQYPSARGFSRKLESNAEGAKKFAAFFGDLDDCVKKISAVTRTGGYQTWTIGNRRIGGHAVPMEILLGEMLGQQSVATVGRIRRNILAKKMATRNNVSATMSTETILLAKKI